MKYLRALILVLLPLLAAGPSFAAFTARGSDSTINVVKALATAFEQKTGTKIEIQGGGSGAGAKSAIAGEVQLAFLSRALDAKESEGGLVGVTYASDAVVVIVHKDNPVADVTIAALKDYFTGTTTQWADGRTVVLYNRNTDSGTREIFQDYVLGKGVAFSPAAAIKHDGVLLASVAKIPSSLAYDGLGHADPAIVKVLSVNGVVPTPASIRGHTYPLTRTPTFATKGAATGETQAFIDFVLGAEGQAIVSGNGLISLK
jgi:phosphate transport system substrate-binding protein